MLTVRTFNSRADAVPCARVRRNRRPVAVAARTVILLPILHYIYTPYPLHIVIIIIFIKPISVRPVVVTVIVLHIIIIHLLLVLILYNNTIVIIII